jgi:Arc/MetJ-type ribon-helix-helix transcriptional regulator
MGFGALSGLYLWTLRNTSISENLTNWANCTISYHMNYATRLVRTSVSLDTGTLEILDGLAKRWSVSKAEVMRRAIRKAREEADAEDQRPSPLQALEWLQNGAGLSVAEGAEFKANIGAER